MEFIAEYGLFLAKVVTLVVALIIVTGVIFSAGHRGSQRERGRIVVTKLNDRFHDMAQALKHAALDEKAFKKSEKLLKKAEKKELKGKSKEKDSAESRKKRVFVLDFEGDIKASATEELRETITAVLTLAEPLDEVVVRLESGGGMVHSYGLAASQLARITQKQIPLTVCVDKVAASGGYMMACVADKILAAPFAILGSIGVVAQMPNFHRVLKNHDVDYEVLTAGEYKRTLTLFGENTEKARQKFKEDLEDVHELFKDFISEHRTSVKIEEVSTGEIWFGSRALDKNLIDAIATSDEYLTGLHPAADIFAVDYEQKKTLPEKMGMGMAGVLEKVFYRILGGLGFRYWAR